MTPPRRVRTTGLLAAVLFFVSVPTTIFLATGGPQGAATGASQVPADGATQSSQPLAFAPAPPIAAASAILMDGRTGTVLYARGGDVPRPPASTTKVLTALVALERLRSDDLVTISTRAAGQRSGSAIGMEPGERWSVQDLLHVLMLASANDAAVALAEKTAGSVEAFSGLMTATARRLGASRSTFVVPHGLYHPRHQATARDLALITREALRSPAFTGIVRRQTWTLARPGQPPRLLINRNRLLGGVQGADGVKTGWIHQSGQCLIASATRAGRQMIAVVLNSSDVFGDARRLLDYGFTASALVRVAREGETVARAPLNAAGVTVPAVVAEDLYLVVPAGAVVRVEVRFRPGLALPLQAGEVIGELLVTAGGQTIARSPVHAGESVSATSVWDRLHDWTRGILHRPPREDGD